jgi:hypothetical protein
MKHFENGLPLNTRKQWKNKQNTIKQAELILHITPTILILKCNDKKRINKSYKNAGYWNIYNHQK